uniref:Autophagy-related protein n=1 Tax=Solanum lycopersicum TaxID=4081 RepID=A0A3Q7EGU5_SOLLC
MGKTFKDEYSYDERLTESQDIIAKYPDRVPSMLTSQIKERNILTTNSSDLPSCFTHWLLLDGPPCIVHICHHLMQVVAERYSKTDLPEMEKKK